MKTEIRFSAWVGAALVAVMAAAQQPAPQPDNRPVQAQLPAAVTPAQSVPQAGYTGRAPLQPVVGPQPQAPVFLPYVPPAPAVPRPGYTGRAPASLLPYVAPYQPTPQPGYQGVIPRPSQNLTWTNRFRRIR